MEMESESEMEMDANEELVGTTSERSEKKESFTPKECEAVVRKVQESGRYTEESIVPVCNDVMGRSSNCEFFAEALSLASSHTDFQGKHFCEDMDRAQFCSEIMDKLLQSNPVADLAFGECERAKPQKSLEYCRRIQKMLGLSVKQEDLDTMRACYMMEAYTNQTASGDKKAENATAANAEGEKAQVRIITGANKELDNVGNGTGKGHPPPKVPESNLGKKDIVLQPTPLESFGKGKGNITKPKGIIAEPLAAGPAPAAAAGAATAPAAAPAGPTGPILAEPIPAPPQEKSQLQTNKVSKPAVVQHAAPASHVLPAPKAPVILEAKVVVAADTKQHSEPIVAHASMVNGTLVMTGTPFGSVQVDGSSIVNALRQQAKSQGQVLAIKQPTTVKAAAATKKAAAPKQVAAAETSAVQPAKAKAGLVAVEPAKVIAAKVAVPVTQPVAPVVQAAVAAQPAVAVQPASVVAAAAKAKEAKAPAAVPAQQVIKIVFVTEPAQPTPNKPAQQVIKVVSEEPAKTAPKQAAPVTAKAAVTPAAPKAKVAAKAVVTPPAPKAQAVAKAAVAVPKPQAAAKAAPPAVPKVPVQAPVAKVAQVATPATQPAPQSAAPSIIQAVIQVHVQPAGQPASVSVVPAAKAPVVAAVPPPAAPQAAAAAPAQKAVVAAKPAVAQASAAAKPVTPAAAKAAVVAGSKQPVTKAAPSKAAAKHIAGLNQASMKHGKVDVKDKKKKEPYAGFLSAFVN
jgi:hypothetical protein